MSVLFPEHCQQSTDRCHSLPMPPPSPRTKVASSCRFSQVIIASSTNPTFYVSTTHHLSHTHTDLVRDLTDKARKYNSNEAALWFAKALQYNVPRGKKNRGLVTVLAYKTLLNGQPADDNLRRAQFLGWCVEMLQSMLLISDDVMDHSETRRGQPCWYRQEEVGLIAINDALMIENSIYYILRKYFAAEPYYVDLLELFHEAMMITTIGQSMDLQSAGRTTAAFTMDRYKTIVHHKTAFYTFYLPVALAMHMAG